VRLDSLKRRWWVPPYYYCCLVALACSAGSSDSPQPSETWDPIARCASGFGCVVGIVVDAGVGEPVSGAAILCRLAQRSTTTAEAGRFSLDSLPPGRQDLEVLAIGYRARVFSAIRIARDSARVLNVRLVPDTVFQ